MANDAAAPVILTDQKGGAHYPIHPLLAERRSLRAFSPKTIEPEILGSLLEAARWAPSCANEQPWSFIVAVKDDKPEFQRLLSCLIEFNQEWAQHAPVLILSIARMTFQSTGKPNRHAFHDVGLAIAALTVQATASALVVHQMAGFDIEKARRESSIPQDHEPVAVAAIGYPGSPAALPEKLQQKELAPRQRKPLENFVYERGWGRPAAWAQSLGPGNR
jgi:nitroreductase